MSNAIFVVIFIFVVAFPKAGIKIDGLPITFGYVALALAGFVAFLKASFGALNGHGTLSRSHLALFAAIVPLQGIFILSSVSNGWDGAGTGIAFITGFIVLPTIFLLLLEKPLSGVSDAVFKSSLLWSFRFICGYAIFLFVFRYLTGMWIEIPYLTVNADDVGTLDEKYNLRGEFAKAISTYNNGNVFGVAVLMLLPLYDRHESLIIMKVSSRIALLLTLSRTVWFGLMAYEVLRFMLIDKIATLKILKLGVTLLIFASCLLLLLNYIGVDWRFLVDANLGGRAEFLDEFEVQFISTNVVHFPSEIMFVSITYAFGLFGAMLFFIAMFAPIVLLFGARDTDARACSLGMSMLLLCGMSDGPFQYIPLMAFYWFLASWGLRHRRAHRQRQVESRPKVSLERALG